ncbi:MoaF-related domain-containing protein [Burkholderia cepacia]|uniref:MoaF-related domain-containing protein n=1 Tax=Burkholderia cepacia TaxID=292 RepID=UPI003EE2C364
MKLHPFAALALSAVIGTASAAQPVDVAPDPHAVDVVAPNDFPPAGHAYAVDFGKQQFRLDFKSSTEMTFTSPDGKNTQTVQITVTRIRPDVYMVFWSRKSGQYVVHVEDFGKRVAYSNIFLPDGSVQRVKGTLTPIN